MLGRRPPPYEQEGVVRRLWTELHTFPIGASRPKLAVLLAEPINLPERGRGPVRLYWLSPRSGQPQHRSLSFTEFVRRAPEMKLVDVLVARIGIPAEVDRALKQLGWSRVLPRQVLGYWFRADEPIPASAPSYLPDGALLPRLGRALRGGGRFLQLVSIDSVSYPLSEAAIRTYVHSSELAIGDRWQFVPEEQPDHPWPTVYEATYAEPYLLPPERIEANYGPDAAARARPDRRAVEVTLVPTTLAEHRDAPGDVARPAHP